jgi:hypothetical protein
MKSVILLGHRRVLWGTVMATCLLSGFIVTTPSAKLLWRSAAVSHVAQGSHFNPAASSNPESRIPNPGYGPPAVGLATTAETAQARVAESYGRLPLSFEINKGQADSAVKFLSRGSGYSLFLTGNEAVLSLRKPGVRSQDSGFRRHKPGEPDFGAAHQGSADLAFRSAAFPGLLRWPTAEFETNARTADPRTGSALQGLLGSAASFQFPVSNFQTPATNNEPRTTNAVLRMKLVGANSHAKVSGLEELPGKSNYFIGNDPKKWRTNVPNYAKVKYANVYPAVDLVYYGNQGKLEYDFVVSPGQTLTPSSSRSPRLNKKEGNRQSTIANRQSQKAKQQSTIANRQCQRPYMSTRLGICWWAPTAAKSSSTNQSSTNAQRTTSHERRTAAAAISSRGGMFCVAITGSRSSSRTTTAAAPSSLTRRSPTPLTWPEGVTTMVRA